jgi:hypothetical protein
MTNDQLAQTIIEQNELPSDVKTGGITPGHLVDNPLARPFPKKFDPSKLYSDWGGKK